MVYQMQHWLLRLELLIWMARLQVISMAAEARPGEAAATGAGAPKVKAYVAVKSHGAATMVRACAVEKMHVAVELHLAVELHVAGKPRVAPWRFLAQKLCGYRAPCQRRAPPGDYMTGTEQNLQSLHGGLLHWPIRAHAAGLETSAATLRHTVDAKTGQSTSHAPQTPVGRSRLPGPVLFPLGACPDATAEPVA